jgi:DNA-binding response OmpR family regulator/HPt (histidine-containing phosphotransfer) domain-containing protein
MRMATSPEVHVDGLQQVVDDARQRFLETFVAQCESLRRLVEQTAASESTGPAVALAQITHRLSGLAGTIGFPAIGACASELEALVDRARTGAFDAARARAAVDAIRLALAADLASARMSAPEPTAEGRGASILVAEDEADQRAVVMAYLQGAGYRPIPVASGDLVVETARAETPAVILLDIAMPELDGYTVCKRLKADPALAGIPVIFMTARVNRDDKLTGLTLGADEFLTKPVDMRELVLRIRHLLARCASSVSAKASVRPAAVPTRTVVIADDDPDVTRIVDSQMRAAGYLVTLAVDGKQALAAVRAHAADVLVLDLMMPNLSGFDVLRALHAGPLPRPRVIVLSGRGREQDVVRAFELGADDYMTKPFNPEELMVRVARLQARPAVEGAP